MLSVEPVLGVDPGKTGALVLYAGDATKLRVWDMPLKDTKSGKEVIDHDALAFILRTEIVRKCGFMTKAFVEQVGAMPGQGVTSMFGFGRSYGMALGALAVAGFDIIDVTPQKWKKQFGLIGSEKDASRGKASGLLTEASHNWPLKKHNGRADAALIAYYGFHHASHH